MGHREVQGPVPREEASSSENYVVNLFKGHAQPNYVAQTEQKDGPKLTSLVACAKPKIMSQLLLMGGVEQIH